MGKKHTCFSCNTKFYDLNKSQKVCPKCKMDQANKPLDIEKKILSDYETEPSITARRVILEEDLGDESMLYEEEDNS